MSGATDEHSETFQGADARFSGVPTGLDHFYPSYPALKRWAKVAPSLRDYAARSVPATGFRITRFRPHNRIVITNNWIVRVQATQSRLLGHGEAATVDFFEDRIAAAPEKGLTDLVAEFFRIVAIARFAQNF